MTFIIHPLFFYLLQIVNTIKSINEFILIITVAALILHFISLTLFLLDQTGNESEKKTLAQLKTNIKILCIPTIICLAIAIFCPEKSTIVQMTIATNVTYENLETIKGTTAELVDYIIDKTKEITDNKEDE